jgi:membrane-associated phospholipid phosphatase
MAKPTHPLPDAPAGPDSGRRLRGWVGVLLLVAAGGILFGLFYLDPPLTRLLKPHRDLLRKGELGRILRCLESYGHGIGALIAVLIVALAVRRWKTAVRMAAALAVSYAPYLLLSRLLIRRWRPDKWPLWASGGVWSSFGDGASFPSGHTVTAFAFSVVLAAAWPRGRWLFVGLAAGCAVARVLTLDHYASDVFAGAVLGAAGGLWAGRSAALGRLIDRIEARRRRAT